MSNNNKFVVFHTTIMNSIIEAGDAAGIPHDQAVKEVLYMLSGLMHRNEGAATTLEIVNLGIQRDAEMQRRAMN